MLDERIRSACHEEDSLVKIDADTVIMSGDELRCFAGRKDLIFWGSGSVEQRIYGCLYGMKAHAAKRVREYVRGLELLPDAPEDIVIGTSALICILGRRGIWLPLPMGRRLRIADGRPIIGDVIRT